jgi:hypothetical protein
MHMNDTLLPVVVRRFTGRSVGTGVFAILLLIAGSAAAQTPDNSKDKPITSQTHPNNPELWNVDAMMEDAVKQIARHYNLTREQEDFTRLLLIKRTRGFLNQYEREVRELLKESIDLRQGKLAGGADAFKKWAERAAPIYDAAKKAILDGNKEWRVTLNDDQKKIHDNDMALMQTNFDQVARTLETWRQGGGSNSLANLGRKTRKDLTKSQLGGSQSIVQVLLEDNWMAYVKRFIQVYKLDEKQAIAAQEKIHKEMHEQAIRYREKHKSEFAEIDRNSKSATSNVKPTDLVRRRVELERPIRELFVEMNQRLLQLIDTKQITGVDPEAKHQLETLYNTLAGTSLRAPGANPRAVPVGAADGPQSRPATDTPTPADKASTTTTQAATASPAATSAAPVSSGEKPKD